MRQERLHILSAAVPRQQAVDDEGVAQVVETRLVVAANSMNSNLAAQPTEGVIGQMYVNGGALQGGEQRRSGARLSWL